MEKIVKTNEVESNSSHVSSELEKPGDSGNNQHEDLFLFAEEANELYDEKNEYRITVFKRVKELLNSEQGDFVAQHSLSNEKEMSASDKMEAMSQIDEHFFCDDIFRRIHKICFGHIDNREETSSHIMHRVLAGESVNIKLEAKRTFVYDKDGTKAETLLKHFIDAKDINELFQMRDILNGKVGMNNVENLADNDEYTNIREGEQDEVGNQTVH